MQIVKNVSLKKFNTFSVNVYAEKFVAVTNIDDVKEAIDIINNFRLPFFILGGGSNILFTKDFAGLVIKNELSGIEIINQTEDEITIKAGAGEVWHNIVLWAVNHGYGGIENLSLIPGSVGAGPIQNIGAYGVELKDVFYSLDAIEMESGELKTFYLDDCKFNYRNSIFKNELKNKFIIISVSLRLSKKPILNIEYGSLKDYLVEKGTTELDIKTVSDAVCAIRSSKLPDPNELGNSGSFFKNPIISREKFNRLKENHSKMVGYPISANEVKVAAGWLIEACGWKGKRVGDTGSHAKQALVLVNYGNAKGEEIFQLSEEIIESVNAKFAIELEREVNVL